MPTFFRCEAPCRHHLEIECKITPSTPGKKPRGQTNPTILVRSGRKCYRLRLAGQDSGTDRLAHAASQLPRLARRDWRPSKRTTETHASRQHLDHDERLRRSLHGSEAQSQYIGGAAGAASTPHQIAKGRQVDGLSYALQNLMDHFRPQSKIQIPRNRMIALVAGGGFEPPTFGL